MNIIKVPLNDTSLDSDRAEIFFERGEVYFFRMTESKRVVSVYWPDLKFIWKMCGGNFGNLNLSRQASIEDYKERIKQRLPRFESITARQDHARRPRTKEDPDGYPYPTNLSQSGIEMFQANIDEGYYEICKLVKT